MYRVLSEGARLPPNIGAAVFPQAFVIEAVYCRDLSRFVIAPNEGYAVRISDFEA